MNRAIPRTLTVCALALLPALAAAQQPTTVSGQVTASVGGTPLAGAQVSIPTLRVGATTDDEGRYSFTVPASATGEATLTVRRLGYVSRSVPVSLTGAPISDWRGRGASSVRPSSNSRRARSTKPGLRTSCSNSRGRFQEFRSRHPAHRVARST